MELEMFLPSTILVTWHNIVITWAVARIKTITLKRSIVLGNLFSIQGLKFCKSQRKCFLYFNIVHAGYKFQQMTS